LNVKASFPSGLRRRDGEPLFPEPWQAQVIALAANLVDRQLFTAAQWSQTLGEEIRRAAAAGEPDSTNGYYTCALRALERLTAVHGLVETRELAERKRAWIEAYENTPHGQPVVLAGTMNA
jgi:nitrile hydratase accessory protein